MRDDMPGEQATSFAGAYGLRAVLLLALRVHAGGDRHRELMRNVVLWILLAQLLAAERGGRPARSAGPPPRDERPAGNRLPRRGSLAGRRPRG